jgi:acyl carrier protein
VFDLLRQQTGHPLRDLTVGSLLADIPGLDSLRIVEAVGLAEQLLRVEIETSLLENLVTIGDIVDALAGALAVTRRRIRRSALG